MITSSRNPRVKQIRALLSRSRERKEAATFVVEGVRLAEEALLSGWDAQIVLFAEGLSARGRLIVDSFAIKGVSVEEIPFSLMKELSDTETSQSIIVLMKIKPLPLPTEPDFVFIPAEVRDPGNLGTMLRTAVPAGVGVVLIPPDTTDVYAPKVLRAAMGAHFRLPVHTMTWEEIRHYLAGVESMQSFLAEPRGGMIYTNVDYRTPTTLIVGGEAIGAGEQAKALAHGCIYIPMRVGTESLNAATAAAILLFEVVRQRR